MSINKKEINKFDIKKEHKKSKKNIEKRKINVKNNIVRKASKFLNDYFNFSDEIKGQFYYSLHEYFIFFIGFITVFSTSINFLIAILIIVSLDAISLVMLHECPLTTMEKKYLGFTSCDKRNNILKELGIVYKCDHNYEKQVELLINVWCFIVAKCLCIILFNMFNVKLFDKSNIYTNI